MNLLPQLLKHTLFWCVVGTLPDFGCDRVQGSGSDDMEIWCWNHVPLMVALAVKDNQIANRRVSFQDTTFMNRVMVAFRKWLPEFELKIGVELIKSGQLRFSGAGDTKYGNGTEGGLSIKELCHLQQANEWKISLASVYCLRGLTLSYPCHY
ncbi:hypothetical protein RJ641_014045 [Dillenia turbinata]|uniref:Uncharacterized protein n=1 Tax=Dillenia turbinata TaxID=194707 RepID=A0AAN8ZQL3_9MAGN